MALCKSQRNRNGDEKNRNGDKQKKEMGTGRNGDR
jgi:hypothetical protein